MSKTLEIKHSCGTKLRKLIYQYLSSRKNGKKAIHTTIPTNYYYCEKCDTVCKPVFMETEIGKN